MNNIIKAAGPLSVTCPTCGRLNGQVCLTSGGRALAGKSHKRRRALALAIETTDKPLAAHGLKSYRYKSRHGWIMIGATDDSGALREARRSLDDMSKPRLGLLEAWNGSRYVPMLAFVVRNFTRGYMNNADDYHDALNHPATTGNDRDTLRRIMHDNAMPGDADRLQALADEIENWKE